MGYVEELRALVGTRPLILPAAGVVVADDGGRLLLGRRVDNGLLSVPGGYMEPGETLEEAARRELLEEAGVTAGDLELVAIESGPGQFTTYANGDQVYVVAVVFLARAIEGDPHPADGELSELVWFAVDDDLDHVQPLDRPLVAAVRRRVSGS